MFNFFKKKTQIKKIPSKVADIIYCNVVLDEDEKDNNYLIDLITYKVGNAISRSKKHLSFYPASDTKESSKSIVSAWLQHLNFSPHHKYEISFNKIYAESIKDKKISIRSVAKVLRKHELIDEYFWAKSADEIWSYIVSRGTVVFVCKWFKGMSNLDQYNFATPTGKYLEDRAFLIYGTDASKKAFICRNCFGEAWGDKGDFYIYFEDIEKLFNFGAQACSAKPI